jgi:hypothetical protein
VVKRVTSDAEVALFHFRKASQGGKEVRTSGRLLAHVLPQNA